ncbi:IQ motif, EF-hand binding site [Phytophthora cactorum]|nr:IQ motif, EF-hand binding site [Phytophthora cactorum]
MGQARRHEDDNVAMLLMAPLTIVRQSTDTRVRLAGFTCCSTGVTLLDIRVCAQLSPSRRTNKIPAADTPCLQTTTRDASTEQLALPSLKLSTLDLRQHGLQADAHRESTCLWRAGGVAGEDELLGQHHSRHPQHREELSQVVGEEISRIIQEQRQLENKYEKLIAQRAVLKGLANKSKFKENQREIQDVSRLLRESTKSLCRNLKENPNFAGNLLKIQQEREGLLDLLGHTLTEMKKHATFETLLNFVAEGKSTQEKAHEILKKEREAVEEVKRLGAELAREKLEHQKEVTEHKAAILRLKEQILAVKSKTQIDIRYARNEAKAKRSSTARMYHQLMEEQHDRIKDLQGKCSMETKVHDETVHFLKDRHEQLQTELAEWNAKHTAKQAQLQELQERKAANAQRLENFQKRWQEEMTTIKQKEEERQRLLELEALRKEELKAQNTAARIIQVAYRAHMAKKEEKRKAAESEKKAGKKGGKKKGKESLPIALAAFVAGPHAVLHSFGLTRPANNGNDHNVQLSTNSSFAHLPDTIPLMFEVSKYPAIGHQTLAVHNLRLMNLTVVTEMVGQKYDESTSLLFGQVGWIGEQTA